jgi:hypothetical protein
MRKGTIVIQALIILSLAMPVLAQDAPPPGAGMPMKQFKVDAFVRQVDADKNGSMSKEEWKAAGLIDLPFTFCDADKDSILSAKEMAGCRLPEAMDIDKDGALAIKEMIEFDKRMSSAPKAKYEATSPYVEGGETGMDFIRVLDEDGDGKVTHAEWEKKKNSTVYKDKHWPEYNKNNDEYITVDEAPKRP